MADESVVPGLRAGAAGVGGWQWGIGTVAHSVSAGSGA